MKFGEVKCTVVPIERNKRRPLNTLRMIKIKSIISLTFVSNRNYKLSLMSKFDTVPAENYFQSLDVVRFICAFMIVIGHTYGGITDGTPYHTLVNNLGFGVEVFFLISGFLITYLLIIEKDKSQAINFKLFYFKRVLRIFPLYYLAILMAPVFHYFFNEVEPNYTHQIFFFGNFELINGWISTAVNHLWSICIEEHFYIVWPILIYRVPLKKLPIAFGVFILISAIFRGYTFLTAEWGGHLILYLHTISRWDTLAIGGLLAYAYYYKSFAIKTTFLQRLPLYLIFIAAFILVPYKDWNSVFASVFLKYIFIFVPAFAIGNILFNPNSILKLKTPGFFHYLGKISYGLYIYHPFAILLLIAVFKMERNLFLLLPVTIITILVSMLSYHFFEKPILSLKYRFFNTPTVTAIEEKDVVSA